MRSVYFLPVELPEDFKKGQCSSCPLSYKIPSYVTKKDWGVFCVFEKNPKDCPLIKTGLACE